MPLYRKKPTGQASIILSQNGVGSKKDNFRSPLLGKPMDLIHFPSSSENSQPIIQRNYEKKLNETNTSDSDVINSSYTSNRSSAAIEKLIQGSRKIKKTPEKQIKLESKISEKKRPEKNVGKKSFSKKKSSTNKEKPKKKYHKTADLNTSTDSDDLVSQNPIDKLYKARILNKVSAVSQPTDLDTTLESLWSQSVIPNTDQSDPPEHFNHYQRLVWLRERRNVGLYVLCDRCNKFRYLKDVKDPLELPELWYCRMNPDKKYNQCSIPEEEISPYEEEEMINNVYNAGSVVWAKLEGYPWWPGIVDDDPDIEQYYWLNEYSDVPTQYHVVFFDSQCVTRAWLKPKEIHKFQGFEHDPKFKLRRGQFSYEERIKFAKVQASKALEYALLERLETYGFVARWPHKIKKPNDVGKISKSAEKVKKSKSGEKTSKRTSKWEKKLSKSDLSKSKLPKTKSNSKLSKSKLSKTKKSKDKTKRKLSMSSFVLNKDNNKIPRLRSGGMVRDFYGLNTFNKETDSRVINDVMLGMDYDSSNSD